MERYKSGESGKTKSKEPEFKFEAPKFKPKQIPIQLPSIESLPKEHYARAYYEARQIPKEFMDKIFYTDDFKKWAQSVCQVDYSTLTQGEPRLVIPFFDEANKLIGAQGRALRESKIRYVTVKIHEDCPKVFGLERWNPKEHTYLVEGPIDSLFLPNSLAMGGADLSSSDFLDKSNTTLVFDNEPRNNEVCFKMLSSLHRGWSVCVWPRTKGKDINEMILKEQSIDKILNIINMNTYSGQRGEWEVKMWKV